MLTYDLVDVFADRPYAGNPLAVVHGAAGLDTALLRAIAREFNLSETTFPTPRADGSYDVRIFTPGGELPFAGHPTLGTAWVLRDRGDIAGDTIQHCQAGEIGVSFGGDRVELAADPHDHAVAVPDEEAALVIADLGLGPDDLAGTAHVAGAGLNFLHLPVRADAVPRARVGLTPVDAIVRGPWKDELDGVNLHAVTRVGERELAVRSRVFCPGVSVPEDPATGSAAAGLGIALAESGALADGGSYVITQGVELGRPSRLECRVEAGAGRATRVHVGGLVQRVGGGSIVVPGAHATAGE